ncbi:N-acetylmuramic acid 6-phosphate etherase [Saccharospirillum sp.]|uniref:N-acetylmuramic acid 6-phosphate etherase n=1 Tax=Saccharospirillum sp. TaxID=2033801 RepID=UPI0034A003B6
MTEFVDPRYKQIDIWPTRTALAALWESQLAAVAAIEPALESLSKAVDLAVARLSKSETGRLAYTGAGTSIRVAVQDGTELGPTFDWPDARTAYLVAGGQRALMYSIEGAEDDFTDAIEQVVENCIGPDDVLVGVAASGYTPFTVAALKKARVAGALTIGIANNPGSPLLEEAEVSILVDTGAEVISGSTRMKAGSAQKIVLNMISTQVMVGLGRVYEGLMVEMRPANIKLRKRAVAMVQAIAGVTAAQADSALEIADWKIKNAVLIASGEKPDDASEILKRSKGNLRTALDRIR